MKKWIGGLQDCVKAGKVRSFACGFYSAMAVAHYAIASTSELPPELKAELHRHLDELAEDVDMTPTED